MNLNRLACLFVVLFVAACVNEKRQASTAINTEPLAPSALRCRSLAISQESEDGTIDCSFDEQSATLQCKTRIEPDLELRNWSIVYPSVAAFIAEKDHLFWSCWKWTLTPGQKWR